MIALLQILSNVPMNTNNCQKTMYNLALFTSCSGDTDPDMNDSIVRRDLFLVCLFNFCLYDFDKALAFAMLPSQCQRTS